MSRDIWVIDWKSSTGVYDEMKTQVACYAKMDGQAKRAGVVRLDKVTGQLDDPPIVEVTDIDTRWEAFVYLRNYYRLLIENNLTDKQKERFYPCDGEKFATITTILGILEKKALPQWSANMTVDYVREHLKEINTDKQIEYYLGKKGKARTAYRSISKKAMDTGSIVHDAIHAHLSGVKPENILQGNDQATNSFLAFLEWADKVKLEPIALEKVLLDTSHKIGGTVDFIGWANIE